MNDTKSILQMARGAFQERVDLEMSKVIDNILDPNTKPTQKRKLTMSIEFAPDDERSNIGVSVSVKSALAPTVVEADGGMWKLDARNTVKKYLEQALESEIQAGCVVVVL